MRFEYSPPQVPTDGRFDVHAGTSIQTVLLALGGKMTIRPPTPAEHLQDMMAKAVDEMYWDAEKQRLIEAGEWYE